MTPLDVAYSISRKPRPLPDLAGKKFARLMVIKFSGYDANRSRMWLCQCECGNEATLRTCDLTCDNTRSCGCLGREVKSALKPHRRRNGPLYIGFGINARNRLIGNYDLRCRRQEIVWALTIEQAEVLFKGNCHYCGAKPSQVSRPRAAFTGEYIYNGIDRVDNSRGYESDNVVSCCKNCNRAKRDMAYEDFIAWAERLYTHLERVGRVVRMPLR